MWDQSGLSQKRPASRGRGSEVEAPRGLGVKGQEEVAWGIQRPTEAKAKGKFSRQLTIQHPGQLQIRVMQFLKPTQEGTPKLRNLRFPKSPDAYICLLLAFPANKKTFLS